MITCVRYEKRIENSPHPIQLEPIVDTFISECMIYESIPSLMLSETLSVNLEVSFETQINKQLGNIFWTKCIKT